jgi:hypothetical protein
MVRFFCARLLLSQTNLFAAGCSPRVITAAVKQAWFPATGTLLRGHLAFTIILLPSAKLKPDAAVTQGKKSPG